MFNKKGFTIIEVLAVIVIISILGTIGVISVNGVIKSSKENSLNLQYESIEETAKSYCNKHMFDEIEPNSLCLESGKDCCTKVPSQGESCYIVLNDLINDKLIEEVKDPKNGGYISEALLIKLEFRNNQFVAEINK